MSYKHIMVDKVQILLADDDEDDRTFFREAVSTALTGADLTTVADGIQLTDYLATVKTPPPPDIIFLDINMPFKNGKDCLREIRNDKKYNDVLVVMFSTSSHLRDVEETYAGGANRYICKADFFDDEVNMLQALFRPDWKTHLANPSKTAFLMKAV